MAVYIKYRENFRVIILKSNLLPIYIINLKNNVINKTGNSNAVNTIHGKEMWQS